MLGQVPGSKRAVDTVVAGRRQVGEGNGRCHGQIKRFSESNHGQCEGNVRKLPHFFRYTRIFVAHDNANGLIGVGLPINATNVDRIGMEIGGVYATRPPGLFLLNVSHGLCRRGMIGQCQPLSAAHGGPHPAFLRERRLALIRTRLDHHIHMLNAKGLDRS